VKRRGRDPRVNRRELLAGTSVAVSAVLGEGGCKQEKAPPPSPARAPRFFTRAELAMVDELAEIILPADAHSPGARAAGVALEIDRWLADLPADRIPEHAGTRQWWKIGLGLLDSLTRARHGAAFLRATARQRAAVVAHAAAGEGDPRLPEHHFFIALKAATARAYYTSEIGIRQELEYRGNGFLEEFVGHDASTVPVARVRAGTPRRR
jgi:hypothetical protein